MRQSTVITTEEWISAMDEIARESEKLPDRPKGVVTCAELQERWGCGVNTARQRIRRMMSTGMVEPARIQIRDITGRNLTVPAYRVAKAGK